MIDLYKPYHSNPCKADIQKRIASGRLKEPVDLRHYAGCDCA